MKPDFEINLIKSEVMPLSRRRAVFLGMIVYFIIIGIMLVTICHKASVAFVTTVDYKRDIANLMAAHRRLHPTEADAVRYAEGIKARLSAYADKIETLKDVLSKDTGVAYLLRAFSSSLPQGAYMGNFNFNGPSVDLNFDMIMPEAFVKGDLDINDIINYWKNDPGLMKYVKDIESVSSRKQMTTGGAVFVYRFSCSLLNKGA